ncbi:hypothetical protein ZWY2020_002334 [Hordeum vulgare]|nr:hypothetical protein ZWY2020_020449 [Hordeum vulgare]KAI4971420.1 hypothetical protein ZWY2020_002334 [Hordeum vulgare]
MGTGASGSVGRAGEPRRVRQFGSRPWRGAGAATSIDGLGRPFRGRAPAAAPRSPPSNLGSLPPHRDTPHHTAAARTGAGERIGKKAANKKPIRPRGGLSPARGREGISRFPLGAGLLALSPHQALPSGLRLCSTLLYWHRAAEDGTGWCKVGPFSLG